MFKYSAAVGSATDPLIADTATNCVDMTHAAQAYHNYYTYIEHWAEVIKNGSGSTELARRPKGYALFNDNTTVTSSWINQQNVTVWGKRTRYISKVTMAMPHLGVIQAAQDPSNNLVQPTEVDGASYNVIASVPSPVINVLCMTLHADDLKPFVYEFWPEHNSSYDLAGWPHNFDYGNRSGYLNGTDFDDIFRWGLQYGANRYPPVFPKLPIDYNTLSNDTTGMPWGRTAIYVLGKGPPTSPDGVPMEDTNYSLCQMEAGRTSRCSTHYNASASGAMIEAVCEDPNDMFQYGRGREENFEGNATLSTEWPNIASEWANSKYKPPTNNSKIRVLTVCQAFH